MSIVGLGTLPADRLRVSPAPMAEAAARYLPMGAAALVTLGAIMALTTSVNATMFAPSRVAIVLAEDGAGAAMARRCRRAPAHRSSH
jgi:amino acid transporter